MRKIRIAILVIIGLTLAAAASGGYYFRRDLADAWRQRQVASIPPPTALVVTDIEKQLVKETGVSEVADTAEDTAEPVIEPEPETNASEIYSPPSVPSQLPNQVNLDIPMVYQAPFNVWDLKHEDACEEASILMVKGFLDGRVSYTRQEMEDNIMALIDYQNETCGYFESTTVEQTAEIMRDYLNIENVVVLPVDSIDDIRRQLAAGMPVIIPADGKTLKNPNFRGSGPIYHMLVAKGYTETHIITNDPGTRRGANWLYTNEVIVESLADWVQDSHGVNHSERYMIVVSQ